MKMTKKKVFVAALAICVVAILSLGTLAWFSDSDNLTNKFYIAESTDTTADSIFSVDVKEEGDAEDDGLEYVDILPGSVLPKKATVTNTSGEGYDQYIRVIITIADKDVWQKMIMDAGLDFATYDIRQHFVGFDSTKWDLDNSTVTYPGNSIQYVLYYKDKVAANEPINVFDAVEIPTFMTRDHAAAFNQHGTHGFNINIKAQAVQTENVVPEGTTAGYEAWAAFETVKMSIDA